jgi:hypothetical protein
MRSADEKMGAAETRNDFGRGGEEGEDSRWLLIVMRHDGWMRRDLDQGSSLSEGANCLK